MTRLVDVCVRVAGQRRDERLAARVTCHDVTDDIIAARRSSSGRRTSARRRQRRGDGARDDGTGAVIARRLSDVIRCYGTGVHDNRQLLLLLRQHVTLCKRHHPISMTTMFTSL